MLILSRKPDETLRIGSTVQVTIIEFKKDSVRIGITHPQNMPVRFESTIDDIPRNEQTFRPIDDFESFDGPLVAEMSTFDCKAEQSLILANEVTLIIVKIESDKVRLGIEHPNHIAVCRE